MESYSIPVKHLQLQVEWFLPKSNKVTTCILYAHCCPAITGFSSARLATILLGLTQVSYQSIMKL